MQKVCSILCIFSLCGFICYTCMMSANYPNYEDVGTEFHLDSFLSIFDNDNNEFTRIMNESPLAQFEFTGIFSFLNVFLTPIKVIIKIIGMIGYVVYRVISWLIKYPTIFSKMS